jgi:hypothetical protein
MAQWTINYSGPSVTETDGWWTASGYSTLMANPHPMVVFSNKLYIADGQYLHTYDGTTQTGAVLTLPAGWTITALEIDSGTGRLMLGIVSNSGGVTGSVDTSIETLGRSYVGLYDGISPFTLLRTITVDAPVTAFQAIDGHMYVIYGGNIGMWNGAGIDFVRDLKNNISSGKANITYKQQVSNIGRFLLVGDNSGNSNPFTTYGTYRVIAYGEAERGNPAFFPIVNESTQIHMVSNLWLNSAGTPGVGTYGVLIGGSYLNGDSSGNEHVYFIPLYSHATVLSTGDSSPLLVTKRYNLGRPCEINLIRIFYEDTFTATSTAFGTLSVVDDNRQVAYSEAIPNTASEVGLTSSKMAWIDVKCQVKSTEVQLAYQWTETATNHGIRKVIIFYTPYE